MKKLRFKKPKTAYGLLREIQREMRAEPLRVDMEEWLSREVAGNYKGRPAPACGTVGCIAGWGRVIAAPRSRKDSDVLMARLLGFKSDIKPSHYGGDGFVPSGGGFAPNLAPLFFTEQWPEPFRSRLHNEENGTAAYAEVVCDRIDAFIAEHSAHLRRTHI
jgi:hypothetical protein